MSTCCELVNLPDGLIDYVVNYIDSVLSLGCCCRLLHEKLFKRGTFFQSRFQSFTRWINVLEPTGYTELSMLLSFMRALTQLPSNCDFRLKSEMEFRRLGGLGSLARVLHKCRGSPIGLWRLNAREDESGYFEQDVSRLRGHLLLVRLEKDDSLGLYRVEIDPERISHIRSGSSRADRTQRQPPKCVLVKLNAAAHGALASDGRLRFEFAAAYAALDAGLPVTAAPNHRRSKLLAARPAFNVLISGDRPQSAAPNETKITFSPNNAIEALGRPSGDPSRVMILRQSTTGEDLPEHCFAPNDHAAKSEADTGTDTAGDGSRTDNEGLLGTVVDHVARLGMGGSSQAPSDSEQPPISCLRLVAGPLPVQKHTHTEATTTGRSEVDILLAPLLGLCCGEYGPHGWELLHLSICPAGRFRDGWQLTGAPNSSTPERGSTSTAISTDRIPAPSSSSSPSPSLGASPWALPVDVAARWPCASRFLYALKLLGDVNVPGGKLSFISPLGPESGLQQPSAQSELELQGERLRVEEDERPCFVSFGPGGGEFVSVHERLGRCCLLLAGLGQINTEPGRWWAPGVAMIDVHILLYKPPQPQTPGPHTLLDAATTDSRASPSFSLLWTDHGSPFRHMTDFYHTDFPSLLATHGKG